MIWDELEFFTKEEFEPGADAMSHELLRRLDDARAMAKIPFRITSAYRMGDDGAHGSGEAVDIGCTSSRARYHIVNSLLLTGFNRIGVYDKHVHADVSETRDQDVIWWGTSK